MNGIPFWEPESPNCLLVAKDVPSQWEEETPRRRVRVAGRMLYPPKFVGAPRAREVPCQLPCIWAAVLSAGLVSQGSGFTFRAAMVEGKGRSFVADGSGVLSH